MTFYVQGWFEEAWETISILHDRLLADMLSDAISKGWDIDVRTISETALRRSEGIAAVRAATQYHLMDYDEARDLVGFLRKAKAEVAHGIAPVYEASVAVTKARDELDARQGDLLQAIREAHELGHSPATIANVAGLSRQRVHQIVG